MPFWGAAWPLALPNGLTQGVAMAGCVFGGVGLCFSTQAGFSLRTFTRAPQTQHVLKPPLHAACAPPGAGRPGGTPRAHGEHAARRGDGGETLPRQVHHPGFAARAFQLHGHTDTPLLQPSQPAWCRGTSAVTRKSVLGLLGWLGLLGPFA